MADSNKDGVQALAEIGKSIEKELKDYNRNGLKQTLENAGKDMKESIKKRWVEGLGVNEPGGNPDGLKSITRFTIRKREEMRESGDLATSLTDPSKSNLIATGETYNKLDYKATKKDLTFSVGDRSDILADNEARGRTVLNVSADELDILMKKIDEDVDLAIERALKDL